MLQWENKPTAVKEPRNGFKKRCIPFTRQLMKKPLPAPFLQECMLYSVRSLCLCFLLWPPHIIW